MDEFAMGSSNENFGFRTGKKSVGHDARSGRKLGRFGGGGGFGRGSRGARFGNGRLGPPAGFALRNFRPQTDLRAHLALRAGGVCLVARPNRRFRANGRKMSPMFWASSPGATSSTRPRRMFRCRITSASSKTISRAKRSAFRALCLAKAWTMKCAKSVEQAIENYPHARRGDRRRRAALRQIRHRGLLHHRHGRGFVEPGAV